MVTFQRKARRQSGGTFTGRAARVLMIGALAGGIWIAGCAGRKPIRYPQIGAPPTSDGKCINNHYQYRPFTGNCELDPVPGHPKLHYGPAHLECSGLSGDCEVVRDWYTEDGKQVLSPVGCWLARFRITWLVGDTPSMCESK